MRRRRTSGIEVTLDLAPDLPLIHADADQLHQVLLNLIINAQQALQEQSAPRRLRVISRPFCPPMCAAWSRRLP